MTYVNELKAKLVPLAEQMQGIVNTAKNDSNRGLTSQEREQFHKLEEGYTAIEDSIKIAEKKDSIVETLAKTPGQPITDLQTEELQDTFRKGKIDNSPYGKSFSNYLRNGERTSQEDRTVLNNYKFQNAQTITSTAGGYIIPTGFSNALETATKWFGGIGPETCTMLHTSTGAPLQYPTLNDTTNKGRWISINTQATETDLTFGQVTFNAYIYSSDSVLVPLALIQDSYFDIQGLLTQMLGVRRGRLLNNAFTVGTGSGQPTGIVTAATTSGNVVTAATGGTVAITYNNLVDLEHTVDPSYRYNPKTYFMFSDTVLKTIKKLVDGQSRPLWQPGLTSSFEIGAGVESFKPTILGHPYIVNNDVAVPAANAYSMVFGDLSKYFVRVVDGAQEMMVLRERYADYAQVGYMLWDRADANEVDAGGQPIALFRHSAT